MKLPVNGSLAVVAVLALSACATPPSFEPSKAGAENDCARLAPHLAEYNACMERVDAEYRAYELQRKLEDEGDG